LREIKPVEKPTEIAMKKQRKFFESIPGIATLTILILLVPLTAMQFTDEVDWNVTDFIIVGALLFGTGTSYVLITRYMWNMVYKAAVALALGSTLFMVWANLAVGLIGAGPNPGNLMYMGVVAVAVIGTFLSRFTPGGMERVMYAVVLALVLVAVIALLANMHEYPGSSVTEILTVNGFFAFLYVISGLLFRYVALEQAQLIKKSEG
jgi:hypothetical protein